jgi:hypothetical protein
MQKLYLFIAIHCFIAFQIQGQSIYYPFSKDYWNIYNAEGNSIALDTFKFKGKQSIKLKQNEIALLQKVEFKNFKLEVDMAGTGMAGIGFRANNLFNYEFLYFRSNELISDNTIQYVPIYNGSTGWQLYPTPEYQKKADFSMVDWFHVTIEAKNNILKLFINNKEKPTMEIDLIRSDLSIGQILLKSEFDPFYYANLKIEEIENNVNGTLKDVGNNTHINEWLVSEQFVLNESWLFWSSGSFLESLKGWQKIKADRNGLVNLSKYFEHPKNAAAVKKIIVSESDITKKLLFDYTHTLVVILNSEVIFYGKEMDKLGRMYDGERQIDIHLKEGKNELLMIIAGDSEIYGDGVLYQGRKQAANWGYIARFDDYKGITLNEF